MFCRYCGKQIIDDSTFCPFCGKLLDETKETRLAIKRDSSLEKTCDHMGKSDYAYYKKRANSIASYPLQKTTQIVCYIALAVFLFFNIKMAPMYGWAKFFCYLGTAAIAIGVIVLFNKKVFIGESKKAYMLCLVLAVITIIASISLRIIYESKVDYVERQIPSDGHIYLTFSEETEYYNSTGTGVINNPSTNIRIGEKWYKSGDIISVDLSKNYSLRVKVSGGVIGALVSGYTDGMVVFRSKLFPNGKYNLSKTIYFLSGPASMAEVDLTFKRFCTFWEVIFY